jgi:hypothetical protein
LRSLCRLAEHYSCSLKDMKKHLENTKNANDIMEAKYLARQRSLEASEKKYVKLEQQYNAQLRVNEEIEAKLTAYEDLERDGSDIRHIDQA